jgi:hypothetical protein
VTQSLGTREPLLGCPNPRMLTVLKPNLSLHRNVGRKVSRLRRGSRTPVPTVDAIAGRTACRHRAELCSWWVRCLFLTVRDCRSPYSEVRISARQASTAY